MKKIEIKICETINGKVSTVKTNVDGGLKLNDVLKTIDAAKKTYTEMLMVYFKTKYSNTCYKKEELLKIMKKEAKTITLNELFLHAQKEILEKK